MTSNAQVQANRANAQKSTGPRTAEGKAVVAQNAVQHGLLARAAVLQGEEWEEYTCFREEMYEHLEADGPVEAELAGRIVDLSWRLRRAGRYQNAVFETLYDRQAAQSPAAPLPLGRSPVGDTPVPSDPILGRMLVDDFTQTQILDRLLRYERRIESSLYKTMAELRQMRRQRLAAGATAYEAMRDTARDRWEARSMGVGPKETKENFGQAFLDLAEWDARAAEDDEQVGPVPPEWDARATETHGRDAHATWPPQGGTANESCQTNPIGAGSNVGGTPNGAVVQGQSRQTKPIGGDSNGDGNESCQTNPICGKVSLGKEAAHEHVVSGNLL